MALVPRRRKVMGTNSSLMKRRNFAPLDTSELCCQHFGTEAINVLRLGPRHTLSTVVTQFPKIVVERAVFLHKENDVFDPALQSGHGYSCHGACDGAAIGVLGRRCIGSRGVQGGSAC